MKVDHLRTEANGCFVGKLFRTFAKNGDRPTRIYLCLVYFIKYKHTFHGNQTRKVEQQIHLNKGGPPVTSCISSIFFDKQGSEKVRQEKMDMILIT